MFATYANVHLACFLAQRSKVFGKFALRWCTRSANSHNNNIISTVPFSLSLAQGVSLSKFGRQSWVESLPTLPCWHQRLRFSIVVGKAKFKCVDFLYSLASIARLKQKFVLRLVHREVLHFQMSIGWLGSYQRYVLYIVFCASNASFA
jgi:hypothetical protein